MKCFKELTFASFLNLKPGPRSEAKPLLLQFYLFDAHIMLVLQSLANFGFFINLFSELQIAKSPHQVFWLSCGLLDSIQWQNYFSILVPEQTSGIILMA